MWRKNFPKVDINQLAENIDMDWIRDEPDSSRPDNMVGKAKWTRVNIEGDFI